MKLNGSALVIGGGGGIGMACALAFARLGVRRLVVADINLDAARAARDACHKIDSNESLDVEAISIDVTSEESVHRTLQYVARTTGRIDYCIMAAGVGVKIAAGVADANVAEFDRMLRVNVTGTFLVTRAISTVMKSQELIPTSIESPERGNTRGSIVIVGSASAFVATPNMVQYTTAKHAVLGITKSAALDNASFGIRVNSICPSWVDTHMVRQAIQDVPGLEAMIKAAVPLGRVAFADEVADAAMFFCSAMSSYATGCNMILDGGATLSGVR